MTSFLTRKRIAGAAVVVVVLGGAVAAAGARSDDGPTYRTVTASTESVDQELHSVGTVEPVSQASVAFPVAGTVAGVDVEVGQEVTVGSRLATLDVDDLEVTLHEKQAALDQANLVLQLALDGEDVSGISGSGTPNGGFGRSATAGGNAELEAAQQAVLDAQKAVDDATAAANLAYDNAVSVCSTATVDATVEAGSTTTTAASTDGNAACLAALQAVLDAQAQVTAAQADLTEAVDALDALLDEMANQPTTPTTTTPTSPSTPSSGSNGGASDGSNGTSGGSLPNGSSSSGSSPSGGADASNGAASSSPSAEDLISYQKAVDAATDEVAVAQQAIDQATIVSPIDGRVASVDLAVGDEVEAASSTANVVVVGEGGLEVTTSISVKDLPDVEIGQQASVTPDGSDTAIKGEIVRIGITADTSGSTASYPVTIGLTGDTSAMGNGSTASVVIVTSAAEQALAVPTSAISVDGDRSTGSVLADGKAKTTTVETGAVGSTWTEVTDGLEEGDVVILADLDEPLPGSATDGSSNSQGQGPGGGTFTFPGGGAAPGGGSSGFRPPGN
ncbi:MAG: HlyD family efflux transporter periplasmic adaptor subunit [Aquihabitans sp.]